MISPSKPIAMTAVSFPVYTVPETPLCARKPQGELWQFLYPHTGSTERLDQQISLLFVQLLCRRQKT